MNELNYASREAARGKTADACLKNGELAHELALLKRTQDALDK